jgi:hypothetical protein
MVSLIEPQHFRHEPVIRQRRAGIGEFDSSRARQARLPRASGSISDERATELISASRRVNPGGVNYAGFDEKRRRK